ncbi:hypothetical protein DB88DRAFT_507302 [Papiliotrema laurentii]|uniref:Uncharacterized protein n=1 Tax=Papiliotrema laurentii TaxID=5418 RepID=A0AAD9L964_PAPLA|nr:hypothetical protein DB88DRAFT_507302 [Papiliotrema laurentii]
MYYALQLLVHHADAFTMNPSDPLPFLYLVAPWSPLLPSSHPDHYNSPLAWIPPKLIETQHLTMPHLLTVAKSAMAAWDVASSTIRAGLGFARSSLFNNAEEAGRPDGQSGMSLAQESQTSHVTLETPDRPTAEPEVNGEKLWGKTTTAYFQAESTQGVGQEHLICLNHGPRDTGPDWLEQKLDEVARQVRDRCAVSGTQAKLDVDIWWGLRDKMVPRQGQLWFTKTVKSHPDEIAVEVHEVADGDHSDLCV